CDRCPCSASLHPPQAALGSAALRQNLTPNRALVALLLAHNLALNFPVGVAVVGACPPTATTLDFLDTIGQPFGAAVFL
ncbi:hypothetical protein, partial [uncultured Subdoligranulum sp.]|uniref:hypothetical protein n=1 Tax=uncultured Subdoligranulum sp. TaxID=512298 RepID=UPI0025DB964D